MFGFSGWLPVVQRWYQLARPPAVREPCPPSTHSLALGVVKMSVLPTLISRFHVIPTKIPAGFSFLVGCSEIDKLILKCI